MKPTSRNTLIIFIVSMDFMRLQIQSSLLVIIRPKIIFILLPTETYPRRGSPVFNTFIFRARTDKMSLDLSPGEADRTFILRRVDSHFLVRPSAASDVRQNICRDQKRSYFRGLILAQNPTNCASSQVNVVTVLLLDQ